MIVAFLAMGGCQVGRDVASVIDAIEGQDQLGDLGPAKGPQLSIPPDFDLRPPRPGAAGSYTSTASERAQQQLFGTDQPAGATASPSAAGEDQRSPGEIAFLRQAGAAGKQSDIRQAVAEETQRLTEAERAFVDKLLFWRAEPPAEARVENGEEDGGLREFLKVEPTVLIRKRQGLLEALF
ncbi:MAG: DUF3035 domain-containing protein [Alphaproteobacteria bacterium]